MLITHMKSNVVIIDVFSHYKVDGDNMDDYLKELGISMMGRMIAKGMKPRLVITEKDGKWTLRTETTFKTMILEFTPNVEYEETTADGRELKVIRFDCADESDRCFCFRESFDLKMVNGFKRCVTRRVKNRW